MPDKEMPGLTDEQIEPLRQIITDVIGKQFAEKWEEFSRTPKRKYMGQVGPDVTPPADADPQRPDVEKGILAARAVRYLWQAGGRNMNAAAELAEHKGDSYVAKALAATDFTDGGALLPPEFAAEIIELLSPASVVMSSGVSTRPMNGQLTMPFIDSGSTAAYVGENTAATASQPAFGQLVLTSRKLVALIPESNDLLRRGGPYLNRAIRDDIVRALRVKMDSALIRSQGTNGEPKGMRYWADTGNVDTTNTTPTLVTVTDSLGLAIQRLMDENVDLMGAGWLFAPRTWKYLSTVRDGNNNLVFKPELDRGTLFGFPWKQTTQIPVNLAAGADSEVYFAAFPILVLGEEEQLLIQAFDGAAYIDASSTMQSAVSNDQSVLRAIALHDFGARQRGKEIAVITTVRWGS